MSQHSLFKEEHGIICVEAICTFCTSDSSHWHQYHLSLVSFPLLRKVDREKNDLGAVTMEIDNKHPISE